MLIGCIPPDFKKYCPISNNVTLLGNPDLPWQGDFTKFCATDGSFNAQVGAPCNNDNPFDGINDIIKSDCKCSSSCALIITTESITHTICGNSNGAITLSVAGGTGPYTYVWTGGLSGQNPNNVAPGTYTVTITQTSTGCTATSTAIVNTSTAVTASAAVTQPTCGLNNGSISVSPGPPGYTYTWTAGLSGQNPVNVGPGTYTVTVTQTSTGCTAINTTILNASTTLTASATVTQSSCGKNNGSIRINPSGADYTYAWSGGLTGSNPNNASPGTYNVTVTQTTGGCTGTATAVVTEEDNDIEAVSDSLFVKEGQTTQLNILANDTYPTEAYTLKLGDLPQEYIELLSFEQSGVMGIEPVNIFSEPVTSVYKLCNKCEDCVEGTLYFIDERLKEIILVTMITPKEAANNRLQFSKDPIPGMEVWVYNRWGQQVCHKKDYQNDWDASGYAGGVYYYVLKVYGLTIKKTLTVVK